MREIRTFPLVIEQCAMGKKAFDDLPIKMVILRSYVELPESSSHFLGYTVTRKASFRDG